MRTGRRRAEIALSFLVTQSFDAAIEALRYAHNMIRFVHMTKQRPSFEEIYMELAHALAARSTCARLNVGTVITSTDYRKVLAIGYNGNAAGLPNQCDRTEAGNCGCLHSEENAVINCDSPRAMEKHVFVTHLPCSGCAKRLINLGGVKKIYYRTPYRSTESMDILKTVGIEVIHLPITAPSAEL